MPQDKRKSISYRSFVTCDNPKGVVECGSIRKSKINSQKRCQLQQQSFKVDVGEKRLGNPITSNSTTSIGVIINKEDKKKMCIQEVTREDLDVSKGGDKMNHVINSLSKGKGNNNNQDEIAKGLLRGAFDLQESIVMLGKLQEEAFSSLNMSRSKRKEKHKVEEGAFDCMVNGVSNEKLEMGFQRPRKSTDEMKKVVRDSLFRQNMITNPIFEENYDHRMMHFSDMPSTSSSQSSSRVRSSNFVPSDSSSSSTISQRRKKKDSNLIVRLMGLESPPLSPRWHIEGEKIVNLPRKGQYGAQVLGKKQRSVEEILESLHFKGLLRSSSMNGRTPNSVESEVFSLENGLFDERPPIVIMKPFCNNPHRDVEESIIPKFWLEGIMKPSRDHDVFSHFSEQGKNHSIKKDPKSRTKNEAPRKSVEAEKVSPSKRKGEVNKDERFRDQEKSANTPKVIKQKDGRLISKQQNVSSNSIFDHRKQEICEISDQQRKNRHSAFVEGKKRGKGKDKETEAVYRKDVSNYDNNNVLPVVKSMLFDSFIKQNKPRTQIRDCNVEPSAEYRLNDKMPIYDITLTDTHGYDDSNSCYSEITSVSTNEHYSPVCEVTLVTTHENGIPVNNLGNKSPSLPYEPEVSHERHHEPPPRRSLQTLLLSNSSFLNNLEELFDIQVLPNSVPYDVGKDRVLIDYANEVLHLKSSEFPQPYLPQTWTHPKKARNLPSLDQVLEEIRNDIEDMKDYHGSARDDKFSSDNLYLILDRDLRFKSGIWESGWKRMFSQDEFQLVVRDVVKLILGKLIEEVVLDFMVQ